MRSRITIAIFLSFCISFVCATIAQCNIIYVRINGNNSNNGSTWILAKKTIQAALDLAVEGDEVWAANGTYNECITLKFGVGLYGGFNGYETARSERDWNTNITTIDGNEVTSVVTSPTGATATTIIDGFTIKNGYGSVGYGYGGGIYCYSSSPTISNNTIMENTGPYGGSGIYCESSSPTISSNTIKENYGGIFCISSNPSILSNTITENDWGISCVALSIPAISNNLITYNRSIGIACSYSSANILNNVIRGNGSGISSERGGTISNNIITENDGTGINCYTPTLTFYYIAPYISNNVITKNKGRGISCANYFSCWISDNKIISNTSTDSGGGIYCYASSGITHGEAFAPSSFYISNNIVMGNTAYQSGGGIYCHSSGNITFKGFHPDESLISNNIISGNTSPTGAGIYYNFGSMKVTNNTFTGNNTTGDGGAIFCASPSSPNIYSNMISKNKANNGAALCCGSSSSPNISNNTIIENTASNEGGGVYCYESSAPKISNNIIVSNSSGIANINGNPTLKNNNIYNSGSYNYSGLSAGTSDISTDPLFLAPWIGDYRLRPNSPCVEAGDNTEVKAGSIDFEGKQRIFPSNGIVDMGCYEYDTTPYLIQNISQAKAIPEQCPIQLTDKPVIASFYDAFYIEDPNRQSGLRVISTLPVIPGDLATLTGYLTVDRGERALWVDSITITEGTAENIPGALFVSNKSVGGSGYFWNYNNENCGQQGITNAFGLNNTGLLVKISGKYTQLNARQFTVNDGSGVTIKCVAPSTVTLNPSWGYVSVTGISSCEKVGTELRRLVRVRDSQDIISY